MGCGSSTHHLVTVNKDNEAASDHHNNLNNTAVSFRENSLQGHSSSIQSQGNRTVEIELKSASGDINKAKTEKEDNKGCVSAIDTSNKNYATKASSTGKNLEDTHEVSCHTSDNSEKKVANDGAVQKDSDICRDLNMSALHTSSNDTAVSMSSSHRPNESDINSISDSHVEKACPTEGANNTARVENESRDLVIDEDGKNLSSRLETAFQDKTETTFFTHELGEKENHNSVSKDHEEKELINEDNMSNTLERKRILSTQNQSENLVTKNDKNELGLDEHETNLHKQMETGSAELTMVMSILQKCGEENTDTCIIGQNSSEISAVQNDKMATDLVRVSDHPTSSTSLNVGLQTSTDTNSNSTCKTLPPSPVDSNQEFIGVKDEVVLSAVDNQLDKIVTHVEVEWDKSMVISENCSLSLGGTSPESTHETVIKHMALESDVGSHLQNTSSGSVCGHTKLVKQETNFSAEKEGNILMSRFDGDEEKDIVQLVKSSRENLEPGNKKETLTDNVTSLQKIPELSSNPHVEEVPTYRDINAENRLILALRLSCKLSPGNLVKALDTASVMSLHLMRSLSPGEVSVTKLLQKLPNLSELDLSGNLLGPQGFRVVCLALCRNKTLMTLNLANNLADTDSSECIGIMLTSNCCLESLDVSGNALGNDYFSRCVGPALMKNKSLKTLKFSSCGSTDASAILEALCEGNARIAVLDASNNHFGAAFGDSLSRILQKEGCCLKHLDVHATNLGEEGMASLLAGIQYNGSLVSLNVAGNKVSGLSFLMDFLFSCIFHSNLEELVLNGTKVTDQHDEWKPLDSPLMEGNSSVTKLLLSGCSLTNKALQTLSEKIPGKLKRLCDLDLSSNDQLSSECLSSICTLISLAGPSHLSTLDFSLNSADGIAVDMEKLPELKNLKTLLLKKCRITPPSLVDLSKFIALGSPDSLQISALTLDGIRLSGTDSLRSILGLSADTFLPTIPCGSLELLSLTGCGLNDRDVKPLMCVIAAGNGVFIKEVRLSANRLTDTAVDYLIDQSPGTTLSLQTLDLSINKIRNGGAEKLAGAISSNKLRNLNSLSLADSCIGKAGIRALVGIICPASHLRILNLRSQQQPLGEEDMDEIMEQVAMTLGFDLQNSEGSAPDCSHLPSNLSINLTGLGGEPGELGPKLDSQVILTDYSSKHRRTLTLQDALKMSAVLTHQKQDSTEMSQRDWNLVISADKDAPAWLQLASQRECAVYVSNLPLSVTAEKLEGLLDNDAECNVKEVYLLKDQVLRKPNGLAWVLFTDITSVQRAVDYYNSGQAVMYGTPFVISTIYVHILAAGSEENVKNKAMKEMDQRAEDRKADRTANAELVQSNYKESLARHEYSAQHPAYADGRVW